jgi:hypothetical protein
VNAGNLPPLPWRSFEGAEKAAMPRRKIPESLAPPDVDAAVIEQFLAIYAGAPVPPALPNRDPSNRAYMYEGTERAPPRAKTRRLSKAQAEKLRLEYEARVAAGEINPDELAYPDPDSWAARTIVRKRRKVNGRWVWVYRIKGQAGADLQTDPGYLELFLELLKRERDIQTAKAKNDRRFKTIERNRAKVTTAPAQARANKIIAEFNKLTSMPEWNRASKIAANLKVPVRTVRDVLKKYRG